MKMKNIINYLIIVLLSVSCANYKLETSIENESNDVLAGESFLRYSSKRFEIVQSKGNSIQTAVTYCHQGDYTKGLELLKVNLKKEKENPNYWNHLGTCYYLNNQLAKAKYYFQISLEKGIEKGQKNSNFLPAYNNLGLVYLKLRSYEDALTNFKLADAKGKLLTPKFNMLQLYLMFGQLDKAYQLGSYLYRKSPLDVDIISSLGTIHLLKAEYKVANQYFQKLDKKYLDREDISGHYAIVLYKLGKLEEAKRMLQNGQYTRIKSIKNMRDSLSLIIERELKVLKELEYDKAKKAVDKRS